MVQNMLTSVTFDKLPDIKYFNSCKGFTLAEVLITLVIVGVIATMTIPTLMNKTNKQEYVVGLKKAYSTLAQVTNKIIAENGNPKCSIGGWACTNADIYNMYKKYLTKTKECATTNACSTDKYALLVGGKKAFHNNETSLVTADGMRFNFIGVNTNCEGVDAGNENGCFWIRVDVNGNKKPNIIGRDAFQLVVKETGLVPAGCDAETRSAITPRESCVAAGWQCACTVLTEGKMDY